MPLHLSNALISGKALEAVRRPLNLVTLASVTGKNASRNKVCDVLAVVESVDPCTVKRDRMPLMRNIRIVDPSTDKIVILSVFTDAVNFLAHVGQVALFRSVTTHDWHGGHLCAYPSHCEGKNWYIPNPVGIEGCDVEGLRIFWVKRWSEGGMDAEARVDLAD